MDGWRPCTDGDRCRVGGKEQINEEEDQVAVWSGRGKELWGVGKMLRIGAFRAWKDRCFLFTLWRLVGVADSRVLVSSRACILRRASGRRFVRCVIGVYFFFFDGAVPCSCMGITLGLRRVRSRRVGYRSDFLSLPLCLGVDLFDMFIALVKVVRDHRVETGLAGGDASAAGGYGGGGGRRVGRSGGRNPKNILTVLAADVSLGIPEAFRELVSPPAWSHLALEHRGGLMVRNVLEVFVRWARLAGKCVLRLCDEMGGFRSPSSGLSFVDLRSSISV